MGKLLRQARRKAKTDGERARIFNRACNGHPAGNALPGDRLKLMITPLTWVGVARAGEGNRTLMTSLEDRYRAAWRDVLPSRR
jgi:hypothetical protein